jgi:hypothetical protein
LHQHRPTEKPGHEDDVKFVDITQLLQETQAEGKRLMFTGTVYGVVTMLTSLPMVFGTV